MMDESTLLAKFCEMDKDGSGSLSRKEVKRCMKASGFDDQFVNEFIKTFDLDGDGQITLSEYKRVLNIVPQKEKENAMWRSVFNEMDKDKSGKISLNELVDLLKEMGYDLQASELKVWMSANDGNKDGEIDYEEFLSFMNRS